MKEQQIVNAIAALPGAGSLIRAAQEAEALLAPYSEAERKDILDYTKQVPQTLRDVVLRGLWRKTTGLVSMNSITDVHMEGEK